MRTPTSTVVVRSQLQLQSSDEYGNNDVYSFDVCADDDTLTCESIDVTITNWGPFVAIDAGDAVIENWKDILERINLMDET